MAKPTLEELAAAASAAQAAYEKALTSARSAELAAVKEKIHTFGFTTSELGLATRGKGKVKKEKNIKYQNPQDHSQTWSGFGRQPRWVADSGMTLEQLLVK